MNFFILRFNQNSCYIWGQSDTFLDTVLGLQVRLGDKRLKFQVVCPQKGTAVLTVVA